MNSTITWDNNGFYINGEPKPLISGEFHYFRVPKQDWEKRLIMLKQSGANTVATYIPWIVHEHEDGNIVFDDCPERDLTSFLKLCDKLDIMVIARPGPLVYSELVNSGLPVWLMDGHPEIHALKRDGSSLGSASYLHPYFLERAEKYIHEADKMIKPFLATNGGPIISVQVDNELSGIHIWYGSVDYNPVSMGFGDNNGYYCKYLKNKYGTINNLNNAYSTEYNDFCDVDPRNGVPKDNTVYGKRFEIDYFNFYCESLVKYSEKIVSWFMADGIDVPLCNNAASVNEIPIVKDLPEIVSKMTGKPFLLGVDHYYTLNPDWGNDPTPQYFINWMISLDQLHELGMPPSVLELQSGNLADFPPILPEHISAMYMTEVALGMKGSNYYIFTGGKNFLDTGNTADIYDYHAPVGYDNEIRPIYYAQKDRNEFSQNNTWMQQTERSYDVQIGFTWEQRRFSKYSKRYSRDGLNLGQWVKDVVFTLETSSYQPKLKNVCGLLNINKPLILTSDERMSAEAQISVVNFIKNGGKLIITPFVPKFDEDYNPCTILKDYIGMGEIEAIENADDKLILSDGTIAYYINNQYTGKMTGGKLFATNGKTGKPLAYSKQIDKGTVFWLGASWRYLMFSQNILLERILDLLGTEHIVKNNCRSVWTTVFEDDNNAILFVVNLLSGRQKADISVKVKGKVTEFHDLDVPPMTVLPLKL